MRSYCKDTQSLPARSLLNPEVRCLLLKLGLSRLTLKAANRRVLRRFQEVEVGGGCLRRPGRGRLGWLCSSVVRRHSDAMHKRPTGLVSSVEQMRTAGMNAGSGTRSWAAESTATGIVCVCVCVVGVSARFLKA